VKLQRSVTVGQLLAGMDEFYKDYKNLNITTRTAVSLVSGQLTGENITEKHLQNVRRVEAERAAKKTPQK
jgi:hypothetical protein